MTNKITPQQAYEAAKVLWPNATHIEADPSGWTIRGADRAEIDWPEGSTQWPMPEPRWRDARMPEDYGKQARFCNGAGMHDYQLCGVLPSGEYRFIDQHGIAWRHCLVRDQTDRLPR